MFAVGLILRHTVNVLGKIAVIEMALDQKTFNELVDFLIPYMETERERQTLIDSAFYGIHPKPSLDYTGTSYNFCIHLVRKLDNYGQVQQGIYALQVLLEEIETQVGVDKREKIHQFKQALYSPNNPLKNATDTVEQLNPPIDNEESVRLYQALIKNLPPLPSTETGLVKDINASSKPFFLSEVQRTVGIIGDASSDGTGFFISRNGIIATSVNCIGIKKTVDVELLDGRQLVGRVLRIFPSIDLAFVKVEAQLQFLLSVGSSPKEGEKIVAVTHSGHGLITRIVDYEGDILPYRRFSTYINHIIGDDAGGNPVFWSKNNLLVGMLTSQKTTKNYHYVLSIESIYKALLEANIKD